MDAISIKHYTANIFDTSRPTEMTGPNNIDLAKSFYKARYNDDGEYGHNKRADEFDRNAGAVQLFHENGFPYSIPGKEGKNYNCVSFGNRKFKKETLNEFGMERSSYGHSERVLMRDILDDLIESDADSGDVSRPSELGGGKYKILKELTNGATPYKEYLTRKGLIVKMWSERPACENSPRDGVGGGCLSFIKKIFPAGSHYGFIVKDYTIADSGSVEKASTELKNAYKNFRL